MFGHAAFMFRFGGVKAAALLFALVLISMVSLPDKAEAWWGGQGCTLNEQQGKCTTAALACESWSVLYGQVQNFSKHYHPVTGEWTGYDCVMTWRSKLIVLEPWCQRLIGGPYEKDPKISDGCKPIGFAQYQEGGYCDDCDTSSPNKGAGNPINVITGNKFQAEVDYQGAGTDSLRLVRYYNSASARMLGTGMSWRTNFDMFLHSNLTKETRVVFQDGREERFYPGKTTWYPDGTSSRQWMPEGRNKAQLTQNPTNWELKLEDNSVAIFDTAGNILSLRKRNGYTVTWNYAAWDVTLPNSSYAVADSNGRQMTFNYAGARVQSVVLPDGQTVGYAYDAIPGETELSRLIKVTYPDATPADPTDNPFKTYLYENAAFPYALTGIVDENGQRFATWTYDQYGRAVSSEHAGGAERTTVAYDATLQRTVTNAQGKQTVYTLEQYPYGKTFSSRITRIDEAATASTPAASRSFVYDNKHRIGSKTDRNGVTTTFARDGRGLPTTITHGAGTPEQRVTTYTWHADFRLPTRIVRPGKTTDLTYDATGLLLTRTETDTTTHTVPYATAGKARTWTFTYTPEGRVATIDGPRVDVADVTTFAYDAQGNLTSVTNALGHAVQVLSHDASGRPTAIQDANGVRSDLAYDPRGRLASVTVTTAQGPAVTALSYDAAGQITTVTRPDGSTLNYAYDAAHRLTGVANGLGETIAYTLDVLGNRTAVSVNAATGALVRAQTRTFDDLGRLLRDIGAAGQVTAYAYDLNDNVTAVTDPLGGVTARAFDALDRLVSVTDPLLGVAAQGYDAQDNLTAVTDQRGLTTAYVYDGFGNVIQKSSPDTGVTVYTVDEAGNRLSATDARAVVTNYAYDALGRVTAKTYPATVADNVTYAYDDPTAGANAVGRLSSITDASGATVISYDERGDVVRETRTIAGAAGAAGVAYVTAYAYDLGGNLVSMTYPSGRIVNYQRDAQGRVVQVTTQTTAAAPAQILATGVTYDAFGPVTGLAYGNGTAMTVAYDADGRMTALDTLAPAGGAALQSLRFTYDAAGRITAQADLAQPALGQTYAYDALHRLTAAGGGYGSVSYGYDSVGNRLSRTQTDAAGTVTSEAYTYDAASNRLLSVAGMTGGGASLTTLGYTADGSVASVDRGAAGLYALAYNPAGRLSDVSLNAQQQGGYVYNALGQRVAKTALVTVTTTTPGDPGVTCPAPTPAPTPAPGPGTGGGTGGTGGGNAGGAKPAHVVQIEQFWTRLAALEAEQDALKARKKDRKHRDGEKDKKDREDKKDKKDRKRGDKKDEKDRKDDKDKKDREAEKDRKDGEKSAERQKKRLEKQIDALGEKIERALKQMAKQGLTWDFAGLGAAFADEFDLAAVTPAGGTGGTGGTGTGGTGGTGTGGTGTGGTGGTGCVPVPPTPPSTTTTTSLVTTHWHYDGAGRVIAVSDAAGAVLREHVYLGGLPIALIDYSTGVEVAYAVHTDHLGTPRVMTDAAGAEVWRIDAKPFGETVAVTGTASNDNRFPGQVFDAESGLHYNYFRDYDPSLGRYLQSDPIGLRGGLNTYAYVGGNPVSYVDPTGELGIAGAAFGAGFELAAQLIINGGKIECVDWADVALMGALGSVTPSALGSAGKAWKAYKATKALKLQKKTAQSAKRINKLNQRVQKNQGKITDEIATQGLIAGFKAGAKKVINDPETGGQCSDECK